MNFTQNVRKITLETLDALEAIDQKIGQLNKEQALYHKETFTNLMNEVTEKRDEIIRNGRQAVVEQVALAKKAVAAKYTPSAADITEDAILLTSGIELTAEDVRRLCEKHAGNLTMCRMLTEYADKNHLEIESSRYYKKEADKLEEVDSMMKFYNNAIDRPMFADVWRSDNYFAEISEGLTDL